MNAAAIDRPALARMTGVRPAAITGAMIIVNTGGNFTVAGTISDRQAQAWWLRHVADHIDQAANDQEDS